MAHEGIEKERALRLEIEELIASMPQDASTVERWGAVQLYCMVRGLRVRAFDSHQSVWLRVSLPHYPFSSICRLGPLDPALKLPCVDLRYALPKGLR